MNAAEELAEHVGIRAACEALGVARATFYRHRQPSGASSEPSAAFSPRALDAGERQAVLDTLHSPRFLDQAPQEVYATLLDEGVYFCSIRTMYRILEQEHELRERRNQLRHPNYQKPELLATAPNQVWSWDITKLLGPVKWTYFYLYVILDIFSRYVVGWMVANQESTALAKRLLTDSCAKQGVVAGQLTIYADRGPSMKSKGVAMLLADLGVTKTHSRPHVSNDNPYSESQFKTLKYRPAFPERFGSVQHARKLCRGFFCWYNTEHRHSGIGLMTPEAVHHGRAGQLHEDRRKVLSAFFDAHPERFVLRKECLAVNIPGLSVRIPLLGYTIGPLSVRHIRENLVLEQLGENRRSLRATRWTESPTFAGESHEKLGATPRANDAGET